MLHGTLRPKSTHATGNIIAISSNTVDKIDQVMKMVGFVDVPAEYLVTLIKDSRRWSHRS